MSVVKFDTGKAILFLRVHMYHKIMRFESKEHLDKVGCRSQTTQFAVILLLEYLS